ncbi:MAG: KEOPS complex kinase/ATPase Bud32, partial [archaeon]
MKLIYIGAEAKIFDGNYLGIPTIIKKRIPKKYRIKEIDEKIRSERTKEEAYVISKAYEIIRVPRILEIDLKEKTIVLEKIEGCKLKDIAEDTVWIFEKVGRAVAKMHENGIVHGDLTTSNILIKDDDPYFIDFGLSFFSKDVEDFAMDLLVFEKMLISTHWKKFDEIWDKFLTG